MSIRAWKSAAVIGLVISLGLVAYAVRASMQAAVMFGPSAIAVGPAGDVFIGVNDQLWRASAEGHLLQTRAAKELGLPGSPANLIQHPDGHLVATVRGDPRIYFLDAESMNIVRSVLPDWPSDLVRHGHRAINLAFHPDGRIAIATGGGHTVALFDAKGTFLARTVEDTYKFTNGLWWVGNALWTTDTNRFMLKVLNGHTLSVDQTISLPHDGGTPFLGPARVHPKAASAATPMAALIRFTSGMQMGRVVVLSAQGFEMQSPGSSILEPMDMDWLGDGLILTDARSFSVLKWNSGSDAWEAFGDAQLKKELQQMQSQRKTLRDIYRKGLAGAAMVFMLAFFAAFMAQQREDKQRATESPLDLTKLGTPEISGIEHVRRSVWIYWPVVAVVPFLMVTTWFLELLKKVSSGFGPVAAVSLVLAFALMGQLLFWLGVRKFRRISRLPEAEAVLNRPAIDFLKRSKTVPQSLMAGEKILEAFFLMPGFRRLVVLTEERLMVFCRTLTGELRLQTALTTHLDVVSASTGPNKQRSLWSRLTSWGSDPDRWLSFELKEGKAITGWVATPLLARRIEMYCNQRIASQKAHSDPVITKSNSPAWTTDPRRVWLTLASAVFPGSGQWIQRRQGTALKFFVAWLCLLFFAVGPTLWTLVGPKAEVPAILLVGIAICCGTVSFFSAADAWHNSSKASG